MSQQAPQAQAAPAPAPPTGATTPVPAATTGQGEARSITEDVPGLLNRLQVLAVTACVLFGLLAAVVQVLSWQANGRAADNTEQVVRVQEIQASLLRADALATTAFLVGGLEPPEARAAYDAEIDDVLRLVTDAAEAQSADREVLADLNVEVRAYTTAVAQARDYNRQNLVIGIAYLNSAGDALRADAIPIVQALVDANASRAEDEMDGQSPLWLLLVGVLAVAALLVVNRAIARRFHRRVNVGVVGAAVGVGVLTVVVSLYAGNKSGDNDATREGPYRTAVSEASARTAANDAKAQESQGLINRGAGETYEVFFDEAAAVVEDNASPVTLDLWQQYVQLHEDVRALDDSGRWDEAVAFATATDTDAGESTPTTALDVVDAEAEAVVDEAAAEATDAFGSGGAIALTLAVLTLLGGLVAAGAAAWGINQRRREYS